MDSDTVQLRRPRPYRPFLPLFFSIAGWVLLQAWIALIGANYRAHILVAVPGAVLTLWSAFPFPGTGHIPPQAADKPDRASRWAATADALLLLAIGAVLGGLIAKGSLFLLCVGAMALHFVPWPRLRIGQRHPALPCAAALCGFAAAVLAGYRSIEPMFLPLAAWALWVCACIGLILRAEQSWRAKRRAAARCGYAHPAQAAGPASTPLH